MLQDKGSSFLSECHLDLCCCFRINLEITKCNSSNLFLLQVCSSYSNCFLACHMYLRKRTCQFLKKKEAFWDFSEHHTKYAHEFGENWHLCNIGACFSPETWCLSCFNDLGLSFYISLSSTLQPWMYGPYTYFEKWIPKTFMFSLWFNCY
jgi:hypothetical protein